MPYILKKDQETIEVMDGRHERRERLLRAGYEWTNRDQFENKGQGPRAKGAEEESAAKISMEIHGVPVSTGKASPRKD